MRSHYPIAELFPWAPLGLIGLGLIIAAVAGALILHAILFGILERVLSRRYSIWHAITLRARAIARYAFIIIALSVALPAAPLPPDIIDSAHKVLLAAFIVFLGWLAIITLNVALERYTQRFNLNVADNLQARKAVTQLRVFKQALDAGLILLTAGFALMSFDSVREFGISLFASAGVAGIAAGLAARPVLGNLIAGMQIAVTQPIRLGDVLVINTQWGTVEEITSTYVVMKLWDWRRYVVPLSYFFDNPFENWTRTSSNLIGTVYLYVDYTVPVQSVREKLEEIAKGSKLWDGKVVNLQVSDAKDNVIELRALVSAGDSSRTWDLRCEVREKLISYLQRDFPGALPRQRGEISLPEAMASNEDNRESERRDNRKALS